MLILHFNKFPVYKEVFSLSDQTLVNWMFLMNSSHSCIIETIAAGGQHPDPLINSMVHTSTNPCIPSRCFFEVPSCTQAYRTVTLMEIILTKYKLIINSTETLWGHVHQLRPCEKLIFLIGICGTRALCLLHTKMTVETSLITNWRGTHDARKSALNTHFKLVCLYWLLSHCESVEKMQDTCE